MSRKLMREKRLELKRGNLRKEIEKLNQHNLSLKRKSFLKPKNVKQEKLETIQNSSSALIDDVDALVLLFEQVIEDVRCKMLCKLFPILHQKIGMMGNIREILDKAKTVTRFMHSYAAALNHMRNHTCVHDLVKASKSKLAILILTTEYSLRKVGLEKMLISSEWEISCWASQKRGEEGS
ncbi:hypothetical protein CK203_096373 [Vitis vinifera]|uniref:Uncharacterized protein n=1 Tax=Vitis vinifera TaxID=29760 RepID=A0A438FIH2_VITVI|nr:hypothetical protein CK203_096373 [Vitis vinifera]